MPADLGIFVCPHCRGDLVPDGDREPELACGRCSRRYPVIAGIPDLRVFPDPYIDIESDRAKGRRIAERFADHDFAGLLSWYYQNTSVVPREDAQRYIRGMLGARARAEAALDAWSRAAPAPEAGALLEVGCGSGPLLAAAAGRFRHLAGVDIAFRWLVVARKRLEEAGLDLPLACACAEALPLRDAGWDVVVFDSTLEVVRDQPLSLSQAHRALRGKGRLWITTPNRWSLGPDPHVGTWAAAYLPERVVFRRVLSQGGIAPHRRLLSLASLRSLLGSAGFAATRCFPPAVPSGQRAVLSGPLRAAAALYDMVRRLPVARLLLLMIGPVISAVATRSEPARRVDAA